MKGQAPFRARARQLVQLVSLLAFPITLNYFSPYVIIAASAVGVSPASIASAAMASAP